MLMEVCVCVNERGSEDERERALARVEVYVCVKERERVKAVQRGVGDADQNISTHLCTTQCACA